MIESALNPQECLQLTRKALELNYSAIAERIRFGVPSQPFRRKQNKNVKPDVLKLIHAYMSEKRAFWVERIALRIAFLVERIAFWVENDSNYQPCKGPDNLRKKQRTIRRNLSTFTRTDVKCLLNKGLTCA